MNEGSCRRAQQRYDLEIPVEVTYEGRTFTTISRNLSLGGMFLHLDEPIPFGETIGLRFELPDLDHPVEVEAHVRWTQPGLGVGVQYTGLRAREVWALQQLFSTGP